MTAVCKNSLAFGKSYLAGVARDTRERLLDTALKQFAARGVEAVAVTDLESGAGLSPGSGSFYRHFRTKEDVLAAVVDREVARALERRSSAPADLAEHYAWALDNLDRMRGLVALLVREGPRLPHLDRVQTLLAEEGTRLDAADLAELMKRGEIPTRDPEAVAAVVLFAIVGHHLAGRFFGGAVGVPRERFAAALASLVAT
jgi:AcrR family transcriptional regulator